MISRLKIRSAAAIALSASLVLLQGCASNPKVPFADADTYDNQLLTFPDTKPVVAAAPVPRVNETDSLLSSAVPSEIPFVATPAAVPVAVPMTAQIAVPAHVENQGPQNPDEAYEALISGNQRFSQGTMTHRNQEEARRRALANVQRPFAVVLSCSDSRVPPELVFDQGLGDLFTVRVAGNILGSAQVASIEYAIEHLGAKLVVVMGHESCGAVRATLESVRGKSSGSTDLDWLVSEIRPNVEGEANRLPASLRALADPKFRQPVMRNVDVVTESLIKRSAIVRHALEKDQIRFVRGIYALETGKVDFWGYGEAVKKVVPSAPSQIIPAALGRHEDPVTPKGERSPASQDSHGH